MNKKFVYSSISVGMTIMVLIVFLLTGVPSTLAVYSSDSGYNDPVFMNSMNFTATLENGAVHTSWTPYAPDGFNYYKVIRSATNSNPVYPDDSYIKADSNPDASGYVDYSPKSGTAYYRVCSIAKPNRYCSNVMTINNTGESVKPELYDTPIEPATITLEGAVMDGYLKLTWVVDGYSPKGFKVVKSTVNEEPVYPIMKGDAYQYFSLPGTRASKDYDVIGGKTYYYRVCQYNGSGCTSYSNAVSITTPADFVSAKAESVKDVVSLEPAAIHLEGVVMDSYLKLTWTIDGGSPYGFKIAKSTVNENPTYPPMAGDTYRYLSDPNVRLLKDEKVSAGKTYHYRVCQYTGSGCASYSNAIHLAVPDDFVGYYKEPVKTITEYDKTTTDFYDAKYHTYSESINYLKSREIVEGYSDGTFKPDYTINRAEFMKIVVGAKYSPDYISVSSRQNCFSDVRTAWYAPYVCIAKDEGVVGGYPDGTFKPEQFISFVEAAKILAEVYGLNVTKGIDWYTGYVKALQEHNYIPSTIGALDKTITRAEMAELIWRIKEQKRDQAYSTLIEEDVIMNSGEYAGWKQYSGDGFTFYHPNWYQGMNWGRITLTEELDFYQNFGTSGYMAIDTYMHVYEVAGSNLNTNVWFDHPFVSSKEMTINGVKVLKRHYRAPRGTVVNGRTTGENENIYIYSYQLDGKVAVLHYFNAHGIENKDVEIFYKIAESFKAE